jgi:hypothetical protein
MRALGLILFVGCASNGGSVSGNPPGGSFDISDMISATVTTSDGAGDASSVARIVMASNGDLCSDAGAGIDRKGEHYITIQLSDVTGAMRTAPTAAGTYTIYPDTGSEPAKSASFTVVGLDSSCQAIDADSGAGQSGTVTLTSVAGGVFTGSFDVTLNTGDHLTGSFAPSACPQLAAASTNGEQHTCR